MGPSYGKQSGVSKDRREVSFLQRKTHGVQLVCSLCAFAVINFHLICLGESVIVHPN